MLLAQSLYSDDPPLEKRTLVGAVVLYSRWAAGIVLLELCRLVKLQLELWRPTQDFLQKFVPRSLALPLKALADCEIHGVGRHGWVHVEKVVAAGELANQASSPERSHPARRFWKLDPAASTILPAVAHLLPGRRCQRNDQLGSLDLA